MPPDEYKVTYSEITRIYRDARKEVLTEIPHDFYARAREYLQELREEEESSARTDRAGAGQLQLREASKLLKQIWEFRTRKLLLLAVSQRMQDEFNIRGLSDEETEFFVAARNLVRAHEHSVFSGGTHKPVDVAGAGQAAQAAEASATGEKAGTDGNTDGKSVTATEDEGSRSGDGDQGTVNSGDEMVLVRLLGDVPMFSTEYGNLTLGREDIASIPARYAKVLISRNVAVRIDSRL